MYLTESYEFLQVLLKSNEIVQESYKIVQQDSLTWTHVLWIERLSLKMISTNGWRRINYTIRILNITLILSSRPGHLFKLKGGA